jgi:hypothetical protein
VKETKQQSGVGIRMMQRKLRDERKGTWNQWGTGQKTRYIKVPTFTSLAEVSAAVVTRRGSPMAHWLPTPAFGGNPGSPIG